ncbi:MULTISPECIES: M20 family metallopeptidase [Dickeya]|uniref:Acetylornithine deacetylase/Succinyl-diaminopimelate desuccinylase and related deacylases n=1 Tax=Dickeya aquatica TaxID=1401087 RepID=A0A375ADG7_9GAMM|nr:MULTISPECIES: M20 family metallopeptidase [Dickeya]SLM64085.1 Acetylornithine deacetylase/Succinyl-diaminopimelate desuccinylase and related deacylases [Dickeya aquatica]
MTTPAVIQHALDYFDSGRFRETLARRIAIASESQLSESHDTLERYLSQEIIPALQAMAFEIQHIDNPCSPQHPFLIASRIEDASLPTLLCYGHGDVVFGDEAHWSDGLSPWQLVERDGKWYGRGSADNKGQHSINLAALEQVFQARQGRLGFNCKWLFEMGEEVSSPGLAEVCRQYAQILNADIFIASDGPRLNAERPTLFLGSRGCVNFRLTLHARDKDYHSGNWGGLLSNPGTQLANAIACLVNQQGQMQVAALKPPALTPALRAILADVEPAGKPTDPMIDPQWGEAGLSPSERLFGWNTLEVLSFLTGNPQRPMNAIPGQASAVCQLRFVVGTDWQHLAGHIRQHLDAHGFTQVEISEVRGTPATRLDPTSPLVNWALALMQQTCGKKPALLPNLGGSLPNDVFADILGLPTLWVPHSYPACGQHAVDEHLPISLAREGLQIMTRLFWELGEQGSSLLAQHHTHRAISPTC